MSCARAPERKKRSGKGRFLRSCPITGHFRSPGFGQATSEVAGYRTIIGPIRAKCFTSCDIGRIIVMRAPTRMRDRARWGFRGGDIGREAGAPAAPPRPWQEATAALPLPGALKPVLPPRLLRGRRREMLQTYIENLSAPGSVGRASPPSQLSLWQGATWGRCTPQQQSAPLRTTQSLGRNDVPLVKCGAFRAGRRGNCRAASSRSDRMAFREKLPKNDSREQSAATATECGDRPSL